VTTPFIKTYRLPTPLLLFQIALIPGSLLTGVLLSPLLVLSRNIARKPVRRLRFPQEKQMHRRMLAAGFYAGSALIVGGLVGLWTRWCLGGRDPWVYVVFWLLEGRRRWSRPVLLVYWALMAIISVAAWNRQLARSRKYRSRNLPHGEPFLVVPGASETRNSVSNDPSAPPTPTTSTTMSLAFPTLPNLPNLPNGAQMSMAASDFFDAADKHVPTLSLNARRKSFHALAVVMFLPGIAFDVSFCFIVS
jgi:dolichol kinase